MTDSKQDYEKKDRTVPAPECLYSRTGRKTCQQINEGKRKKKNKKQLLQCFHRSSVGEPIGSMVISTGVGRVRFKMTSERR